MKRETHNQLRRDKSKDRRVIESETERSRSRSSSVTSVTSGKSVTSPKRSWQVNQRKDQREPKDLLTDKVKEEAKRRLAVLTKEMEEQKALLREKEKERERKQEEEREAREQQEKDRKSGKRKDNKKKKGGK